jgi:hypothetical protein
MAAALFVTRNDKVNRSIVKLVEQWQHYTPRIAEHRVDTLFYECFDDYISACFSRGFAG